MKLDPENPMFSMARSGKRLPHVLTTPFLLIAFLAAGFVPPSVVAEIVWGKTGAEQYFENSVLFLLFPFAALVLAIWAWLALYERRPFRTIGLQKPHALRNFLIGLGIGVGMQALTVAFMSIAGAVEMEVTAVRTTGSAAIGSVMLFFLGYIVQGGAEEVSMRGWLLPVVGARHKPLLGIIVSTVVFVAFHGTANPLALINLTLFALFLSFYCLNEGGIWGVCGWHAAWNWTMANAFGLDVSGSEFGSGTILNLKPVGSALLSGGDYGPEGSLLCTPVLLAGAVIAFYLLRKRQERSPATAA